ncbi:MAG: hypothetical protein KatS3mg068_1774 [Candidatus Sericytochromatia bacterium]|nr:MAG: hypothetical protein KatS3mg068_1774 [Candidatus Sericytochromatia bacterium]
MKIKNILFMTLLSLANSCYLLSPVDKENYSDLEGYVFSLDNMTFIKDAEVTINNKAYLANTDNNGKYLIRGIPVGWVDLEVKHNGYIPLKRKVKIEPYGTKYLELWLTKKSNNNLNKYNIVFEREGNIWVSDEYGIFQENITKHFKENPNFENLYFKSPTWFDNKSKIAYLTIDNSPSPIAKNGIWTMTKEGKLNQRLTYIESYGKGLSSDELGNIFLFSMIHPDNANSVGLYKYNKVNNKIESLSSTFLSMDFNPRISYNSKFITYSSSITENTMIRTNDFNQFSTSISQIFISDNKGYNKKQLTFTGSNYDPCFSPDGSKIAFISNRTGSAELWIMNKDGSGQRRLTNTGASKANNPVWSKDGQKILFNTNYKQNYKSIENTNTWVYDLSTYQIRMISNDMNNPDW